MALKCQSWECSKLLKSYPERVFAFVYVGGELTTESLFITLCKTSYFQTSWSLEVAIYMSIVFQLLCNFKGVPSVMLSRSRLSNFTVKSMWGCNLSDCFLTCARCHSLSFVSWYIIVLKRDSSWVHKGFSCQNGKWNDNLNNQKPGSGEDHNACSRGDMTLGSTTAPNLPPHPRRHIEDQACSLPHTHQNHVNTFHCELL